MDTLTIVAAQKSILTRIERKLRAEPVLASVLDRIDYLPLEIVVKKVFDPR